MRRPRPHLVAPLLALLACGGQRTASPQETPIARGELRFEIAGECPERAFECPSYRFRVRVVEVDRQRTVFDGWGRYSLALSLPPGRYRADFHAATYTGARVRQWCSLSADVENGTSVAAVGNLVGLSYVECELGARRPADFRRGTAGWAILGSSSDWPEVRRIPDPLVEWDGERPGMLFDRLHTPAALSHENPYIESCDPVWVRSYGPWGILHNPTPYDGDGTRERLSWRLALCWHDHPPTPELEHSRLWKLPTRIPGDWVDYGTRPRSSRATAVLHIVADAPIEVRPVARQVGSHVLFRGPTRAGVRLRVRESAYEVRDLEGKRPPYIVHAVTGTTTHVDFPNSEQYITALTEPPRYLGGPWAMIDFGDGPRLVRTPRGFVGFDDARITKTFVEDRDPVFGAASENPWVFSCDETTVPWRVTPGSSDASPAEASLMDWRDLSCLVEAPPSEPEPS